MKLYYRLFFGLLVCSSLIGCKPKHEIAQKVTHEAMVATKEYVNQRVGTIPSTSSSSNIATATAKPTAESCRLNFYQGQPPKLPISHQQQGQIYCFNGFSVYYSTISRTPLWSAEHLTRERLQHAAQLERVNNFHESLEIPESDRSTLNDYRNSGYDRGHLSPNADMGTVAEQYDSFTLANIVPQNPEHNRNQWANLENKVRGLVYQQGEAYVVTGTAYLSPQVKRINERVIVPSHLYKAVYLPKTRQIYAFLSENSATGQITQLTPSELNTKLGMTIFPAL